jgi:hypothetical protein
VKSISYLTNIRREWDTVVTPALDYSQATVITAFTYACDASSDTCH